MKWDELIDYIGDKASEYGIEDWGDEDKSVAGNYCTIKFGDDWLEVIRTTEEEEEWVGSHSGDFELIDIL